MKSSEVRELSDSDLLEKLSNEKEALGKLEFTHSVSSVENPMIIRQHRKSIARILTEITARKKKAEIKNAGE